MEGIGIGTSDFKKMRVKDDSFYGLWNGLLLYFCQKRRRGTKKNHSSRGKSLEWLLMEFYRGKAKKGQICAILLLLLKKYAE